MDRLYCKMVAFLVMLCVMLAVTLIPFRVISIVRRHGRRGQSILLTLTCFTGGIFLGTCFLFLVPEVTYLIGEAVRNLLTGPAVDYPFGELIIGAGFFTIMFIERAVVDLQRQFPGESIDLIVESNDCAASPPQSSPVSPTAVKVDGTNCDLDEKHKFIENVGDASRCDVENSRCRKESTSSRCSGKDANNIKLRNGGSRRSLTPPDINDNEENGGGQLSAAVAAVTLPSTDHGAAKAIVFFIAVSLDCILGGLSLGLQRSPAAVWTVLVGILAHEAVVGFGLGLQLAGRAGENRRQWIAALTMAAVYACVGPIGVMIGTGVSEFNGSSASSGESITLILVNGILQGFATGVFVYVTFFELLEGKVNGVMAGFAVMAAIAAVPQSDGSEIDGHHANSSLLTNGSAFSTYNVTLT
jgi:solute carrier family 39 (zinc transporter), member 1/2/3